MVKGQKKPVKGLTWGNLIFFGWPRVKEKEETRGTQRETRLVWEWNPFHMGGRRTVYFS